MTDNTTNPLNSEAEIVAQLELPVVESSSGRLQVVKSNKLIQAQYTLTAMQQKLLSVMIAHANPMEDYDAIAKASVEPSAAGNNVKVVPSLSWRFTKQDIRRLMTIGANNVGATLQNAAEAFQGLSVSHQEIQADGDVHFKTISLINEASYDGHEFKISLTPAATRELYNLRDLGYTKYLYADIDKMKNKYAIRLYELIQKILHPKSKEQICKFNVGELKFLIGVADEQGKSLVSHAERYTDFKRHILLPAIEHINEHGNLELKLVKEQRVGRKIEKLDLIATRIKFDLPEIVMDLTTIGVPEKLAKDWMIAYGEDRIRLNLAYMNNKITSGTVIKNTTAYLKYLVEYNVAALPDQANPHSHLYSDDKAAQEFVKLSIMPNWWDFEEYVREDILKFGIKGNIAGSTFANFKENFMKNTVTEDYLKQVAQELSLAT